MQKLSNFSKNFLLAFGSLAVIFVILEVALRLFYGNQPIFIDPQVMHVRTNYGYKCKPNQKGTYTLDKPVYTNSFGFRDYDWEMPKPEGRIRLMCLGDSITFGNAVRSEDTYPNILEKKLKKINQNIEVINCSAGGWDTYMEDDFFKEEGVNYQPDILIIGFYPNDFTSRPKNVHHKLSADGRLESRPPWLRWLEYKYIFLLKRSALFVYIRDRIDIIGRGKDHFLTKLMENKIDMNTNKWVTDTCSYILEIKKTCDRKNIKLVLASIPPINTFWIPQGGFAYNNYLRAFCESHNIFFIDLAQGFRKVKNTNQLYIYPWDNHLSPTGHESVADQLFPLITKILP